MEKHYSTELLKQLLSIDGNNIRKIENKDITNEILELALNNDYTYNAKHHDLLISYFEYLLVNDKEKFSNYYLNVKDEIIKYMLIDIILKSKIELSRNIKNEIVSIFDKHINRLKELGCAEKDINELISKIVNHEINTLNLLYIESNKGVLFVNNVGDLFVKSDDDLTALPLSMYSYDMVTKTNKKQYKELKNILLSYDYDELSSSNIAINAYSILGYQRAKDLFLGKYGDVSLKKLNNLFSNIILRNVVFEADGKKYKPKVNEELVKLLFKENYKVKDIPIRDYLNNYEEKKKITNRRIQVIENDMTLSSEEKEKIIKQIKNEEENYIKNINSFINNFQFIYNRWYDLKELYLKRQIKVKLKTPFNIEEINKLKNIINRTSAKNMKKGLSRSILLKIKNLDDFSEDDYPLLYSDVFEYVGIDSQYVKNNESAPSRAVELSRMMVGKHFKKFPDVNLCIDGYKINVYNPQDRNILSAGFKSACCFRPNADADNFGKNDGLLSHCVSSEYAGGIEILSPYGTMIAFSPILRNGNVLMLHSIESSGMTQDKQEIFNKLIHKWASEVIKESEKTEKEPLVAVGVTLLNDRFNHNLLKSELTGNNRFRIYDPNGLYKNMYHNLSNKQYVLEFADGKACEDIKYDYEVVDTYEYPKDIIQYKTLELTCEQELLVNMIMNNKYKINDLTIKRSESDNASNILLEITRLKEENIYLQSKLYKISNGVDLLEKLEEVIGIMTSIKEIDEIPRFSKVFYSLGWYYGVTIDGDVIGEYSKGLENVYLKQTSKIIERYNIKKYEISNIGDIDENGRESKSL